MPCLNILHEYIKCTPYGKLMVRYIAAITLIDRLIYNFYKDS